MLEFQGDAVWGSMNGVWTTVKMMLVCFSQSDAVCGGKTGVWTTFFGQREAGVFLSK